MRLLVIALAAALCSAGTASAAPLRAKPCPRHAELTSRAATLTVRVDDDGYHALTACVKDTRRRIVLAGWYAQGSVADDPAPQYWLTGRFAAVNQPSCTPDPFDETSRARRRCGSSICARARDARPCSSPIRSPTWC